MFSSEKTDSLSRENLASLRALRSAIANPQSPQGHPHVSYFHRGSIFPNDDRWGRLARLILKHKVCHSQFIHRVVSVFEIGWIVRQKNPKKTCSGE